MVRSDVQWLTVDSKQIPVNNPEKLLWSTPPVTKLQYVEYLLSAAPVLLAYTRDRLLMMWRYPYGVAGVSTQITRSFRASPGGGDRPDGKRCMKSRGL